MEHHSFLYGALAIFSLLTLASGIHVFSRWIGIPFAVGLLLGGIILSLLESVFSLGFFEYFHFSPEIVFYVFLPTLIFESAYHMNFRHFRRIFREVTVLATFGLFVATGIVGFGLNYFLDIPLGVSLLFGALISATDPVAVLAIFKEIHAPEKLETIVDGESLLNDATGLVLFQFLLGTVVIAKEVTLTTANSAIEIFNFIISLIEGVGVGFIFGFIFSYAIAKSKTKGVQLTLSLVLAHITFLVAEGLLGVSGILATVIAAFVMGNLGRRKLQPETKKSFTEIWQFLGFISNALIFILLGLKIGQIDFTLYWKQILIVSGIILILARPISVYFSFFLTNLTRSKKDKISFSYQSVVMWGGIRGALAAAAVLLIPETFQYAELLQALTVGVILVTFLLNGLTVAWLVKKLKIIDFSRLEKIQLLDAKILISDKLSLYLQSLLDRKYISEKSCDILLLKYEKEKSKSLKLLEKIKSKTTCSREIEKLLSHYALGIEKRTYKKLFTLREITEERFLALIGSILRQIDYVEQDILPEERKETHKVATEIPQKCNLGKLLTYLLPKKLVANWFRDYQKGKILSRMMHYRARRIASWRVIYDFRKLKSNHTLFQKSHIISKIIKRYEGWNENSESKISQMETEFPEIIMAERLRMAEQECFRKEHKIEREFFEKGFLNQKVFEEMEEEVEKKEVACCRKKGYDLFGL